MHKKRKDNDTQRIFLAKEVAEIVISRYPHLSLYDVKGALMSAEEFIISSMYRHEREAENDPADPFGD
ncbi:MAG: hypothetical protein HZA04_06765 [Nitrospinae bacterium]|nr:hypothetical protein [Nitrospinota bacterium]